MDSIFIPATSSSLKPGNLGFRKTSLFFATSRHLSTRKGGNSVISCKWGWSGKESKLWVTRNLCVIKKGVLGLGDETEKKVNEDKTKGSIAGAVALIIGTSIGSGILALPKKASPAGLLPSSITMILCWIFLLIEAFLLIEINVALKRRNTTSEKEGEGAVEAISIRTMAQETLGDWGGFLATVLYVFLGYTSMVAYSSKSGEILFHLINLPESILGFLFTAVFTLLISVGGSQVTDQVNQWLTSSMIGFLIAIEVVAVSYGGWSGFERTSDWSKVPATTPVIIFSLVYHDLVPVLCAYLGGDLTRLRVSVLIGSTIPLVALLIWDAVALGLSHGTDPSVDPVDLLIRVEWGGVSSMVEAFSLLAVGTSMIGTLLGFSEFFKEQIKRHSHNSPPPQKLQVLRKQKQVSKWWERRKIGFTAMAMVVTPALFVSTTVPDAFSTATDVAGGYCMTMLYGVLPPAMAWAMNRQSKATEYSEEQKTLSIAKPAIVMVGTFACGIVVQQILQDFFAYHS